MKKVFSILSYVFAGLTLLGLVGLFFYDDVPTTLWIYSSLAIVAALGLVLCNILLKKNKLVTLFPLIFIFMLMTLFNKFVNENYLNVNVTGYEVLDLLLFVSYIVSLVLGLKKNNKIANIVSLVYVSLLLFRQLEVFFNVTALVDEMKAAGVENGGFISYVAGAFVFLVLTKLSYFVSLNFQDVKKEEAKQDNAEETAVVEEAPVVEETADDTNKSEE